MKYSDLNLSAKKSKHRVGRGIAAGQGKTAGRGTKGQGARTGKGRRPGFEGGQNPLMQRTPKLRGFKAIKPKAELVNTDKIGALKGKIDNHSLYSSGLTSSPNVRVKLVLGSQPVNKLDVSLQQASKTAIAAIEKAGGSFKSVPQISRPAKKA